MSPSICLCVWAAARTQYLPTFLLCTCESLTGLWSGSQSVEGSLLISDVNFFRCPGFMTPIAVRSFNAKHTESHQKCSTTTVGVFLPFKCKQFHVYNWHLYMSCVWYAFRNILLWIISDECPLPWGGLCHTSVSASIHTQTHTLKDKHRVAFTAQTGTHSHVWAQACKWSRQCMRSDWLRLRTHTGGSGDRDRRVMMTSSRSVGSWFDSCAGRSLDRQGAGREGVRGHDLTSGVMRLMVSRSYPAVRKWVV